MLVGSIKFADRATRYDNHAYQAELERLVGELGLEGAVIFAGQQPDVPTIMRAVDAILLPSWEEPFGRVVAEGMAAGRPVIATTVGGPAETIADGRTGLLAPPKEPAAWAAAITRLLDDPAFARRLGAAGRQAVGHLSLEHFYPAMRAAHLAAL
jgi:glycosyltransferase involved in cell wall biosynthesis